MKNREGLKVENLKSKEESLRSELEKYRLLRNCSPSLGKTFSNERRLKNSEKSLDINSSQSMGSSISVNIISNVLSPQTIESLEKISQHQKSFEKKDKPVIKRTRSQLLSMDMRGSETIKKFKEIDMPHYAIETARHEERSADKKESNTSSQGKDKSITPRKTKEKSPIKNFSKYKIVQSQKEREILSFYSNLTRNSQEGKQSQNLEPKNRQKNGAIGSSHSKKSASRSFTKTGGEVSEEEPQLFSDDRSTLNTESEKKKSLEKAEELKAVLVSKQPRTEKEGSKPPNPSEDALRQEIEKWKKFGNLMTDAHEEINEKYKEAIINLEAKSMLVDNLRLKVENLEKALKGRDLNIIKLEVALREKDIALEEERKSRAFSGYNGISADKNNLNLFQKKLLEVQQEKELLQSENDYNKRKISDLQQQLSKRHEPHMSESTILAQELINLRTELDRLQSEDKRLSRCDSLGSLSKEKPRMVPIQSIEGRSSFGGENTFRSISKEGRVLNEDRKISSGLKEIGSPPASLFTTPERTEVRNLYTQFQKEANVKAGKTENKKQFFL